MPEENEFNPEVNSEKQTITDKFEKERVDQIATLEQSKLPFSEGLSRFQGSLASYTEAYYASHGIMEVQLPEHVYRVQKKEGEYGSTSYHGVVEVSARGGAETGSSEEEQVLDNNLAEYLEARTLTHEMYHATATRELRSEDDEDEALDPTMKRVGMIQTRTLYKEGYPALEEGLAQMFELDAAGLLSEHFPDGAQLHDELIDEFANQNSQLLTEQGIDKKNLVVTSYKDRQNYTVGLQGYSDSQKLISYIEQYVPNIRTLAEQVRVSGNEKGLQEAIDEAFVPETYNDILHIREEDAIRGIQLLTVARRLHDKAAKQSLV